MYAQLLSFAAFLLAIESTSAAPTTPNPSSVARRSLSGQATYYGDGSTDGTCSFTGYQLPAGLYGTALSDSNWDNAANCGGCVAVTGPNGNKITAMIVNQCPGCGSNHLDLFPDAFTKLADKSKGIIQVSWDYVPCTQVAGPLEVHLKDGVSANWFSAMVQNANDRTKSLEVSTDNGSTWQPTQRQSYNYFQLNSGTKSNSCAIRVTSESGKQVVVQNVQVASGSVTKASSNYS